MTARSFSFAVLLLIFLIISVFVFFSGKIETDKAQQKSNYIVRGMPPNPPLVKAQGYPPTTEQAKAQWEWWRRMMKQDRGFQWRMPISFYGKVLDQFGAPVSDAKVNLQWSADGSVPKRTLFTDSNGLFSIERIYGKGISISIYKKGYNIRRDGMSGGSFEYADFSQSHFHVPDKNNPYIFRLQKLVNPEPLYRRISEFRITPNQPMILDAMRGKVEKIPMTISMEKELSFDAKQAAYKFIIEMHNDVGLIETALDRVIGTLAPESGYQPRYILNVPMRDLHGFEAGAMFFIKTQNAKYARMSVDLLVHPKGESRVSVTITYNPSGSRNLEMNESLIIK